MASIGTAATLKVAEPENNKSAKEVKRQQMAALKQQQKYQRKRFKN